MKPYPLAPLNHLTVPFSLTTALLSPLHSDHSPRTVLRPPDWRSNPLLRGLRRQERNTKSLGRTGEVVNRFAAGKEKGSCSAVVHLPGRSSGTCVLCVLSGNKYGNINLERALTARLAAPKTAQRAGHNIQEPSFLARVFKYPIAGYLQRDSATLLAWKAHVSK